MPLHFFVGQSGVVATNSSCHLLPCPREHRGATSDSLRWGHRLPPPFVFPLDFCHCHNLHPLLVVARQYRRSRTPIEVQALIAIYRERRGNSRSEGFYCFSVAFETDSLPSRIKPNGARVRYLTFKLEERLSRSANFSVQEENVPNRSPMKSTANQGN